MSLVSSPKTTLDRTCINIVKAEDQPCNVTNDNNNQGPDCYESMHAFKKIRTSTSGLRKSPNKWTKEENQKLASLVASYGEKKWKRISAEMGGQKTGAQCAQHWKRVLSPEIRKGHWDENEEDLLLRLVVQYGSCWKKIAKKIPQRTDIQCRYQYLKAKQSREVMWDSKEDESLVKKVMEMANCNFFQILSEASSLCTSSTSSPLARAPPPPPASLSPSSNSDSGSSPSLSSPSGSPLLSGSPSLSDSPAMASPSLSGNSPMSPMSDSPVISGRRRFSPSPLRNSSQFNIGSPMLSSPTMSHSVRPPHAPHARNKENDDSGLSSSGGSSGSEEGQEDNHRKRKVSENKDAWNDDKHDVNMSERISDKHDVNMSESSSASPSSWRSISGNNKEASSLSESLCANCRSPFISHINKVVWLEISEHMARLKLTSTLRTALECKTRFMELLGNKMPFSSPNQFANTLEGKAGLKNSGDVGRNGLGGSGGIGMGNTDSTKNFHNHSLSDANIGIKINNSNNKVSTSPNAASGYNGSNINLTNCNNNNITINITNSYTTTNTLQNGIHFPQLTNSSSTAPPPMKSEQASAFAGSLPLPKTPVTPILSQVLSPAPPFPSFSHLAHSSFPHLPQPSHQLKLPSNSSRNTPNGLESLAAIASILPREMLADYF